MPVVSVRVGNWRLRASSSCNHPAQDASRSAQVVVPVLVLTPGQDQCILARNEVPSMFKITTEGCPLEAILHEASSV